MHLAPVLGPRARWWLLPWVLAVATLANLAYPMYVHYDFSHSLDSRSYLHMATGQFDSTRVTHRYRVLVPAAAAVLAMPITQVYAHVWPQRPADYWPLRFSFYLVNCVLLAAAGACWCNAARLTGASQAAALLAMLAVLTSRWAEYAAGLPLTDSLYLLVIGLSYYAIRRGSGAGWALALALLVGPLAKESFLLLVPWLCWFGRPALSWPRQAFALTTGLLALAAVHHFIDFRTGAPAAASVSNALGHLTNLQYSAHRAFSAKGLGELLSIFGLFSLLLPAAYWLEEKKIKGPRWFSAFGWAEASLLVIVVAHMALSGDLGRMGYLAAPVFCVALALVFTHSRRLLRI